MNLKDFFFSYAQSFKIDLKKKNILKPLENYLIIHINIF